MAGEFKKGQRFELNNQARKPYGFAQYLLRTFNNGPIHVAVGKIAYVSRPQSIDPSGTDAAEKGIEERSEADS